MATHGSVFIRRRFMWRPFSWMTLHACSDAVRDACRIRLPHDPAYAELMTLFATDLEQQGIGTYADISNKQHDAILPVPYWA